MIYAWCTALTLWLTCTAWLLADTRSKLGVAMEQIAKTQVTLQMLWGQKSHNTTNITRMIWGMTSSVDSTRNRMNKTK